MSSSLESSKETAPAGSPSSIFGVMLDTTEGRAKLAAAMTGTIRQRLEDDRLIPSLFLGFFEPSYVSQPADHDIISAAQSLAVADIQAAEDERVFALLDKIAAGSVPPDLSDWEEGPFW